MVTVGGNMFSFLQFNSINVKCLFTPCHTSGDMCYYVWEDECTDAPAVFTGTWAGEPAIYKKMNKNRPQLAGSFCCKGLWKMVISCQSGVFRLSGDTLFIGGCGKFFEGTAEQMHHNLTNMLASLPLETVSRPEKKYLLDFIVLGSFSHQIRTGTLSLEPPVLLHLDWGSHNSNHTSFGWLLWLWCRLGQLWRGLYFQNT